MAIRQQWKYLMSLINGVFWCLILMSFMSSNFNSIAIVAPFSELQRFPSGVCFKQWTGDDSKALMKVGALHTWNAVIIFTKVLHIGLYTSNWGLCPGGYGAHSPRIYRIRQSSTAEHSWYTNAQGHASVNQQIPSIPRLFCRGWCPRTALHPSSTTFHYALHQVNSSIQCTEWPMYFNYWIKAH